MLIYIVLMIAILVGGYAFHANETKYAKKIFVILVCFAIVFLGAFRSIDVGIDTKQFWNAFLRINELSIVDVWSTRYEPGFVILCYILGLISDSPQILLIASSIIIFVPCFIFIYKNSEDVVLSSFLFVALGTYGLFLNLMRQGIAVAIILLGIEFFYKKKKYVLFVLMCILAMQFHLSAIIAIAIFAFPLIKQWTASKMIWATSLIPVVFAMATLLFYVFALLFGYSSYSESQYVGSNYFAALIKAAMNYVYLGLIIFVGGFLKEEYRKDASGKITLINEDNRFVDTFFISLLFLQGYFYVCSMNILLMGRIAIYFSIFTIIILPRVVVNAKKVMTKFTLLYFILVMSFIYWIIVAVFRPYWTGEIPYIFFI